MTKNEYKDKLLKKLDDCIEAENATNRNLKHHYINTELWCSVSQCENYIIEASCIKHKIMKIVTDYFNINDIETDDSPYKEMWEELKSRIKSRKTDREQDERYYQTNKAYYFAAEQRTKQLEDTDILSVMYVIEKERGIEQ